MRKVNRSFGRLEKQNKNFLNQLSSFRHDRIEVQKASSSNIRAISGLSSRVLLQNAEQERSRERLTVGLSGIGSLTSLQKMDTGSVKNARPSVLSMGDNNAVSKPISGSIMSPSPSPHGISFRFGGSRDETKMS